MLLNETIIYPQNIQQLVAVKRKCAKEAFVKLHPPEMWLCFCQYMRWFILLICNIGCVERDRYFRSASRFIGTPPVFNPCAQFTKNCLRLVTGSLVYIITTLCYQLPLINFDTLDIVDCRRNNLSSRLVPQSHE